MITFHDITHNIIVPNQVFEGGNVHLLTDQTRMFRNQTNDVPQRESGLCNRSIMYIHVHDVRRHMFRKSIFCT